MKKAFLLMMFMVLFASCKDAQEQAEEAIANAAVTFSVLCSTSDCKDGAGNDKNYVFALALSPGVDDDCSQFLDGTNSLNQSNAKYKSTSALTLAKSDCNATDGCAFSTLKTYDMNDVEVTDVAVGTYDAIAWIDENEDGNLDSGEKFQCLNQSSAIVLKANGNKIFFDSLDNVNL